MSLLFWEIYVAICKSLAQNNPSRFLSAHWGSPWVKGQGPGMALLWRPGRWVQLKSVLIPSRWERQGLSPGPLCLKIPFPSLLDAGFVHQGKTGQSPQRPVAYWSSLLRSAEELDLVAWTSKCPCGLSDLFYALHVKENQYMFKGADWASNPGWCVWSGAHSGAHILALCSSEDVVIARPPYALPGPALPLKQDHQGEFWGHCSNSWCVLP